MINFAVMGHGVVGSGVAEILLNKSEKFARRLGDDINLKYILDLRDFDVEYKDKFTKDVNDIINDKEISVVAEVMGGVNPAFEFVKACLESGKSVVTSNKALVAAKGAELLKTAKQHNVNFMFEASVGGGIPIIRPMFRCLAANDVNSIAGILNGTTNFILTKMIKEHATFEDALKTAQELGYAERDPSADVDGDDACRKICILTSMACGKHIYPENVKTEGIRKITLEDVKYAGAENCVIKLVARSEIETDGKVKAIVSPAFVSKASILSQIDDVFNGAVVNGDMTGDVAFYGKGAGKLPTASAVVADMIDCAEVNGTVKGLGWQDTAVTPVEDWQSYETKMYIRTDKNDLDAVKAIFGDVKAIKAEVVPADELAFVTPVLTEKAVADGIKALNEKGVNVLGAIRFLEK